MADQGILSTQPVVTRKEAIAKGLKRYFTGKPCKRGHLGVRYVADRQCIVCHQAKDTITRRQCNNVKATCHPDRAHAAKGLCKPCYMKLFSVAHRKKEHVQISWRQRSWATYGMKFTVADYDALFLAQGSVCAICLKLPGGLRLRVDHDHGTGRVRGLLCDFCNRRLLVIRNTAEILRRASDYVANGGFANTPVAP